MHYFKRITFSLLLPIFLLLNTAISGQNESIDTTGTGQKRLGLGSIFSSHALGEDGMEYDTLIGDVKITQDSFFLYCDTAYMLNRTQVQAFGNVVILQGDSIQIFCDSLVYDDYSKRARLFYGIVFQKGDKRLNTEKAEYDISNKEAYYNEGATLINESQKLLSISGIYEIEKDLALFQGKVSVQDSTSLMQTDSLRYNLVKETAYLIAPTNITSDSTEIYCEDGYYNYSTQIGEFYQNLEIRTSTKNILSERVTYENQDQKYTLTGSPVVLDEDSRVTADTIVFFQKTEIVDLYGQAFYKDSKKELKSSFIRYDLKTDEYETEGGSEVVDESGRVLKAVQIYRENDGTDVAQSNVTLSDTTERVTLYTNMLRSNSKSESYIAYNTQKNSQPLLVKELNDEKLFLKSDTLNFLKEDSLEYYTGQGDITFLKGDISGKSEKLRYSVQDSTYTFIDEPVLWSDSLQISGDTIVITLQNGEIHTLKVISNAFMIIQSANGTYDQVKGDQLICYYKENTIDEIVVDDNVEMVYFMYENDELTGVNHSFCGGLVFIFVEEEMTHLKFKDKPNSTFSKGGISNPDEHNLQGFLWTAEGRPNKISFER